MSKLYQDREWLYEQYVEKDKTQTEIAEECGVIQHTISRYIRKYGIETRESSNYLDEEWLREQYVEKGKTQTEIAEEYGCSQKSVSRYLNKYGIETRDRSDHTYFPKIYPVNGRIEFRDQSNGNDDRFYHHRLIAVAEYGIEEVKDKEVHHKNGIGWCNWRENLELLDTSEHMKIEREKEVENGVKLEDRFNG